MVKYDPSTARRGARYVAKKTATSKNRRISSGKSGSNPRGAGIAGGAASVNRFAAGQQRPKSMRKRLKKSGVRGRRSY